MKKARFKSGDTLWATAVRLTATLRHAEVLIAAREKGTLCDVLERLNCNYVAGEFKQIELRKSGKRKGPK